MKGLICCFYFVFVILLAFISLLAASAARLLVRTVAKTSNFIPNTKEATLLTNFETHSNTPLVTRYFLHAIPPLLHYCMAHTWNTTLYVVLTIHVHINDKLRYERLFSSKLPGG